MDHANYVHNEVADFEISAWPNPVISDVTLNISAEEEDMAEIKVTDALGRTYITQEAILNTGANEIRLRLEDAPKGIYVITISRQNAPEEKLKIMKR